MSARGAALTAVALLVIVLTGCELFFGTRMLEVRVSNESDAEAMVTITQDVSAIGETLVAARIGAGAEDSISVERPGPDPWTILVNDVPVTDSSQWPQDNPTLDFSIHIRSDGSVELSDD